MPSGIQPILDYLNSSSEVKKMFTKYAMDLDGFERLCLGQEGVDVVLSTKISHEGEYVSQPLVETLKVITTEVLCDYRREDYIPLDRRDWWKE